MISEGANPLNPPCEGELLWLEFITMTLDISTPALVFPATTLLVLAYTHRFTHLSHMIRKFVEEKKTHDSAVLDAQLRNFHKRVHLVQKTEAFGVMGLIMSVISSLALFVGLEDWGMVTFVMALGLVLLSLIFALWEILLSTEALHILLASKAPKNHRVTRVIDRFRHKN